MVAIGETNLDVYPLCLGANTFGWTSSKEESFAVLDEYVGAGGNFVDTADVYAAWAEGNKGGESETILGSWLTPGRRDDLVIATKVGLWEQRRGLSAKNVERAAEDSLKRLGTDYIDLYYAHIFDDNIPVEETVHAFARLQEQGKIRHVGVSNFSASQIEQWVAAADAQGVPRPVALQPHYNLVWRRDYEGDLQPVVEKFDLGVMPYQALAAGLLTGKYSAKTVAESAGARSSSVSRHANPKAWETVEVAREVADELNVGVAAVAIAWLLANPTVTAPIASARNAGQLVPLLEGVTVTLTSEELNALNKVSAGLGDR